MQFSPVDLLGVGEGVVNGQGQHGQGWGASVQELEK